MIVWRGLRDEWLMVGLAGLVAVAALMLSGGSLKVGDQAEVDVTIVPGDATELACAGGLPDASCAFDATGSALTSVASPLRPYVTTWGQLVIVSGIFESPHVMTWLEGARGTEARVKVRCPAVVLSLAAPISLRFRANDAFAVREAPVLRGRDCYVVP